MPRDAMPVESNGRRPSGHRLLLVHAHPDDESITTGVTMARYAASGAHVTLVTCTRGERGEVIGAELAHLARDGDALAAHRERELARAMAALGVVDHRFLDECGDVLDDPRHLAPVDGRRRRYRDSGMTFDDRGRIVLPDDVSADAFALADVDGAAGLLARVIAQVRPHVVVGYDPGGGYGHPDHVQAHRVAMRGVERAARLAPAWQVPRTYWVVLPLGVARQRDRELAAAPDNPFAPVPEGPRPSMVTPDEQVDVAVDGAAFLAAKAAALRSHATQVEVVEPYFALSNGIGQPIGAVEYFRLVGGVPLPAAPPGVRYVGDLFAGLPARV